MSALSKARAAWGDDIPEWVHALAAECDRASQGAVAKRIGRSKALVSYVISNTYTGDMTATEELVRGALMMARLECPALGTIPMDECRLWRERARNFSSHNAQRVQMFRACRRCPRFKQEKTT